MVAGNQRCHSAARRLRPRRLCTPPRQRRGSEEAALGDGDIAVNQRQVGQAALKRPRVKARPALERLLTDDVEVGVEEDGAVHIGGLALIHRRVGVLHIPEDQHAGRNAPTRIVVHLYGEKGVGVGVEEVRDRSLGPSGVMIEGVCQTETHRLSTKKMFNREAFVQQMKQQLLQALTSSSSSPSNVSPFSHLPASLLPVFIAIVFLA